MKLFIVGLGLIGGSLAKALKKYTNACIYALDTNEDTIKQALKDQIIDFGYTNIDHKKFDCDLVIVATPPKFVAHTINTLAKNFDKNTIFTDVCSIKSTIKSDITADILYIGGHPMAGTENSGYQSSFSELFKNTAYILTDNNHFLEDIIIKIGAMPIVIPYDRHDYLVGVISHIPHIISAGLVNLAQNNDDGNLLNLVGGGFRDITRISSSSEYMWQQILSENKKNILNLLTDYEAIIANIKNDIENDNIDAILQYFKQAKEYRSKIPSKS